MRIVSMGSAGLFLAAGVVVGSSGCGNAASSGTIPSAAPSASAAVAASASAASSDPTTREGADEVKANYTLTDAPPDPRATKLCQALYDVPAERKAACCSGRPESTMTAACASILSAALRTQAIDIADADIDACRAAAEAQFQGCAWINTLEPSPPEGCARVVKGKLAVGAKCRSSLECAPGDHCAGVSPTTIGVCARPAVVGTFCETGNDPLASPVGAYHREEDHPPCDGVCLRNKCAKPARAGESCESKRACEKGLNCIDRKCRDAAGTRVGDACKGYLCSDGSACNSGHCKARGELGDACINGVGCRTGKCIDKKCASPCPVAAKAP